MRFLFFTLLLFGFFTLSAQIELVPLEGNSVLKREYLKRQKEKAAFLERYTGYSESDFYYRDGDCSFTEDGVFYVFEGDSIKIGIDTSFLGGGVGSTVMLYDCGVIDFGVARLDTITLTFIANQGVEAERDTVCVEFCDASGDCDIFKYPIVVKRRNSAHMMSTVSVESEGIVESVCLDSSVLPGDLMCSDLFDCEDGYGGEGQQIISFIENPNGIDNCIFYEASRFGGVDMVCVVLCDEFTVCDTFRIPFLIHSDTLDLPFFDDFSYAGPYPSGKNWLDKNVFVNNELAKNPPSVGLVTFDGLDKGGSSYEQSGKADYLTSKYINLAGLSASDDIYLKFFAAPKGYGNQPSSHDSLLLEFKNVQGDWVRIDAFPGIENQIPVDSFPAFMFYSFPIDNEQYFYDGFQFRLVNFVSPAGHWDLWHVDYVRISTNEGSDNSFRDMAFTEIPSPFLKTYRSMPWYQFEGYANDETVDNFKIHLYNHFSDVYNIEDSRIFLKETTLGIPPFSDFTMVDGADANISSHEFIFRTKDNPFYVDYVSNLDNNFAGAEKLNFKLEYDFALTSQAPDAFFNDTVILTTVFDNYFAYDDGTAEWQIYLKNPEGLDPTMAVKFHVNEPDTLRAVQFHFPHINGDITNQSFSLKIWIADLNNEPVFVKENLHPIYPDVFYDTLQGFTTYPLTDENGNVPVFLPAGDFYLGWQQTTSVAPGIPVGFDLDSPGKSEIFYQEAITEGWDEVSEAALGSIMLRVVVGDVSPWQTSISEKVSKGESLVFYPNPTTGKLYHNFVGNDNTTFEIKIFNQTGQLVYAGQLSDSIDLENYLSGIYLIQVFNVKTGEISTQKVIMNKIP